MTPSEALTVLTEEYTAERYEASSSSPNKFRAAVTVLAEAITTSTGSGVPWPAFVAYRDAVYQLGTQTFQSGIQPPPGLGEKLDEADRLAGLVVLKLSPAAGRPVERT